MFLLKLLFVILGLITSIYIFKKIVSLKIYEINYISFIFYYLLVFTYLGATLIYLGFDKHYMIQKIKYTEIINKTYIMIVIMMIILPLLVFTFNKLFKVNFKDDFKKYCKAPIKIIEEKQAVILALVLLSITIISLIYILNCIGTLPILEIANKDSKELLLMRNMVKSGFPGNQYIKNIGFNVLSPIVTFLSYTYMKIYKNNKWYAITSISLVLTLISLTLDLSKAPVIYFVINFILFNTLFDSKLNFRKITFYGIPSILFVISTYIFISKVALSQMFSLYGGPIGRILFTQVGTLFLHLEAFTYYTGYLLGRSFPQWIANIFNLGNSVRSGKVVMEIYNPSAVKAGTAGVMNSVFIGEAYANFGMFGFVLSLVLVSLVISFFIKVLIKSCKSPLNMVFYSQIIFYYIIGLQGGFIEYIYNSTVIILLLIFSLIKILNFTYKQFLIKKKKMINM